MRWRIFALVAFLCLAACGDNDSVSVVPSDDSSSSVEEESSSSSVILSSSEGSSSSFSSGTDKKSSSSSVEQSSFSSTDLQSSSSARSSSSVSNPSAESSSSLLAESSSSSVEIFIDEDSSSSSVPLATPCKTETEDNCEYGEVTDDRDGQTYKTVKIGEQWWMAENLNYAYLQPTTSMDSSSFCYNHDPAKCDEYGRLYMWSAAMDSVGLFSEDGKGCGWHSDCPSTDTVRGVCPEGWHLPNLAEFLVLIEAVGGSDSAGLKLKSASGWGKKGDGTSGNGIDAFGFAALSAGAMVKLTNIKFEELGSGTNFWGSTESKRNMYLGRDYDDATLYSNFEDLGFSVRCVKD